MEIQLRLDEYDKTDEQKAKREATYRAAGILKAAGIECYVCEYWTGKSTTAVPASIILGKRY